ncbi:esterase [Penicillium canescens]|nr:esterase [Penicillium canescens]
MEELNRILERFTDPLTGSLHGAVFIAIDRSGKVIYNHASGKATIVTQNASVVSQDSLCWIASMTKLATAVAVMQLVERGTVSLEDDVREIIPELRDIEGSFMMCLRLYSKNGPNREVEQPTHFVAAW